EVFRLTVPPHSLLLTPPTQVARRLLGSPVFEDPEGHPTQIGGPWTWLVKPGTAITPDGIVHIHHADYDEYMEDEWWRDHEHQHIWQYRQMRNQFLLAILLDYKDNGYDNSNLEKDANNWANFLRDHPECREKHLD
ncbi:MAG: hypothetical protein WCK51_12265, partial [Armatimonadota bacterium]